MRSRILVTVVAAAAVAASATSAVLQATFGSSASAASGGNGTTNQILHHQEVNLQKELAVDEKILVQLKLFRKSTETSLTTLNASTANVDKNTANIDKNAADTLVPLNSLAADGKLLVDDAPGAFQVAGTYKGFVPKLLSVMDSFCYNAQSTRYGNDNGPNPILGC